MKFPNYIPQRSGRMQYGLVLFLLVTVIIGGRVRANPEPNTAAQRLILQFQHEDGLRRDFTAYTRHDQVYVPVVRLFGQLSVKIDYDPGSDFLSGFFLLPEQVYTIDLQEKVGKYGSRRIPFDRQAYIKADDEVFLDIDVLNRLFELGLHYEPRELKVRMRNSYVFPYMHRQKRRKLRKNQLEANRMSDSLMSHAPTLTSDKRFLNPGITDWQINQTFTKYQQNSTFTATHSGILAGGDYRIRAGGILQKQDYGYIDGRWRWVKPESPFVRQVQFGSSIDQPDNPVRRHSMEGIYITNFKPVNHGTLTSYQIGTRIQQNREVALYHNRRLVDYRQTDQSGDVSFTVPVGYGSHDLALRIYGPYGEYREVIKYLNIPSKMIPAGGWRYELAAGYFAEGAGIQKFGTQGVSWSGGYGMNDEITLKTGGNLTQGKLPTNLYINLLWNLQKKHYVSGYLANGGEWMGSWNYRQPGEWGFRVRYERRKSSVPGTATTRAPARVSWMTEVNRPWQYGDLSGNSYVAHHTIEYRRRGRGSARVGTNLQWKPFRVRLEPAWTYRIDEQGINRVSLRTRTSVGIPFIRGTQMRLRSEWNHLFHSLANAGIRFHKRINRWWQASFGGSLYERGRWSTSASFRLTLPFSKTTSRVQVSSERWNIHQQMGGSIWYDRDRQSLSSAPQSWSQKGKVVFKPFLDADRDGVKSKSENWIDDNRVSVAQNGASGTENGLKGENLFLPYTEQGFALDLKPFSEYQVSSRYRMVHFRPYPYIINYVSIPMTIQGTLSGRVRKDAVDSSTRREPTSWRVLVIRDSTGKADTLQTLPSGRFYHHSLDRGNYTVLIHPDQLDRYNLTSKPRRYQVAVEARKGKRRITNLQFSVEENATH